MERENLPWRTRTRALEAFIIPVLCWVEDGVESVPGGVKLRPGGFVPRVSDREAIPLELGGELRGHEGDEAIWSYFKRHGAAWFPGRADRSTCVRQAANLWRVKQLLHERLGAELGARAADGHIIDGFPSAVGKRARAVRSQVLKAEADYGYWAAKREYYYGLKAHLLIDRRGVAVGLPLTPANVDEREAAYDGLQAMAGLGLGDKGYIRPQVRADCEAVGLALQTPVRQHMTERRPRCWLKLLQRVRKRIETVISQFEQRFGLANTRARDAWHLTNQVTRKLWAHTGGVWLNLRQGREPLDLEGLLAA